PVGLTHDQPDSHTQDLILRLRRDRSRPSTRGTTALHLVHCAFHFSIRNRVRKCNRSLPVEMPHRSAEIVRGSARPRRRAYTVVRPHTAYTPLPIGKLLCIIKLEWAQAWPLASYTGVQ